MSRHTFSTRSFFFGTLSLALAVGLVACGNSVASTGGEGGGNSKEPTNVDFFSCDVQLSCPAICTHLGPGDCSNGANPLECPGALWLEGGSGAIQVQERPGPGNWMGDDLILLLGDGTAIVQRRERSCIDCDPSTLPWVFDQPEHCDVAVPPDTCQPDACSELPVLENCVPLTKAMTCEEIATAIAPAP